MSRTNRDPYQNIGSIDGFVRRRSTPRPAPAPSPIITAFRPPAPQSRPDPLLNQRLTARRPVAARPLRKSRRQAPWKRLGAVMAVLVLLVGGWTGATALHALNKVFHGNIFGDAKALISAAPLNGESTGRVNILLAGDSNDDPGHGGADLTDSIMILSIDTRHHTAFMLSVPRDLWVHVPGTSHEKINAANENSNFNAPGYPGGGMGQLQQIVQEDLGIPINYYALINYTAFRDSVNAVGGISVNVQSTDPRGLFDPNISRHDGGPLKLANGVQTLSGQQALNLARARGDPCYCGQVEYGFPASDYDRTQHQRMMLVALEQKALSAGVLSNPLTVAKLFNSLGNNVKTDMTAENAMRLVQITKGINLSKIQSLAYSNNGTNALLVDYQAPDGEEALIPKAGLDEYGQLQQYYQQLVSNNPIVKEAPTVVVLNGTNMTGLARRESNLLKQQGYAVLDVGNTDATYDATTIVDNTKGQKPASLQALTHTFKTATTAANSNETQAAQGYTADFVVILGSNWSTQP